MGRVVVSEFITLDGVATDPGGFEGERGGGWAFKFSRGEVESHLEELDRDRWRSSSARRAGRLVFS